MITELVSGALGAILGALLVFVSAQRSLRAENVIAERRKWRDEIRRISKELMANGNDRKNLSYELALRLNPKDDEDREIVRQAAQLDSGGDKAELVTRLALLLKHDWDRAKIESSWLPFRTADRTIYSSACKLTF